MTSVGPFPLGRVASEPDSRDQLHLAADRLKQIRTATPPFSKALLKMSVQTAYNKGYFRTAANCAAFFKWLKTQEAKPSPTPTPPSPSPSPTPLRAKRWSITTLLNQLQTPHCIGFGGTHWGIADPTNDKWTTADAHALYYACKVLDGEPKAEDGSSVRTLAQELQKMGRLNEYVWCARVDETGSQQGEAVADWLLNQGPVIFGTNWYEDMFNPDAKGLIKPTGKLAGGHCFLGIGVDLDTGLFEFAQSWGYDWGVNGHFFMKIKDMQTLLDQQGEAMAGLELPIAA